MASAVGSLQSKQGPETSSSLAYDLDEITPPTNLHEGASQLTLSPFSPSSDTATTDAGSSVVISKPPLTVTSFTMPAVDLPTVSVRNSQLPTLFQHALNRLHHLTISQYLYLTLLLVSTLAYLSLPLSSPISSASRTLAELACAVLAYLAALTVPLRVRFFLHPMITCTAITLTFIAIIEAIKGRSLTEGLNDFSTGRKYLVILGGGGVAPNGTILWPGAGDVLFSLMDAAIVSLGIVMFKYRAELKKHVSVFVVSLLNSNDVLKSPKEIQTNQYLLRVRILLGVLRNEYHDPHSRPPHSLPLPAHGSRHGYLTRAFTIYCRTVSLSNTFIHFFSFFRILTRRFQ